MRPYSPNIIYIKIEVGEKYSYRIRFYNICAEKDLSWMTIVMNKFLIPKFYSFISFRSEDFGGFLFNPHMMRELPLDSFESGVAAFCDGSVPLLNIIESMSRRFKIDLKTF